MNVIAERYKSYGIVLLIIGVLFLILSIVFFNTSYKEENILELVVFLFLSVYCILTALVVIKLPKAAVVQKGEYLYVSKLFSVKEIKISTLVSAGYGEIGEWWHSNNIMQYLWYSRKDIRTVTIAYQQNGSVTKVKIYNVFNATNAVLSIRALIPKK